MSKKMKIDIPRGRIAEFCKKNHIRKLSLFGSVLRNDFKPKSDIDILVTFSRDIDLFDFLDLREYLESKLHNKVDLVMETALKPTIGKYILAEVEYV